MKESKLNHRKSALFISALGIRRIWPSHFLLQGFQGKTGDPGPAGVVGPQVGQKQ